MEDAHYTGVCTWEGFLYRGKTRFVSGQVWGVMNEIKRAQFCSFKSKAGQQQCMYSNPKGNKQMKSLKREGYCCILCFVVKSGIGVLYFYLEVDDRLSGHPLGQILETLYHRDASFSFIQEFPGVPTLGPVYLTLRKAESSLGKSKSRSLSLAALGPRYSSNFNLKQAYSNFLPCDWSIIREVT